MRNQDQILLEGIYRNMLLLEDEQSRIKEAEKILIADNLKDDYLVFSKRHKTPEDLDKIEKARVAVKPILDQLLQITSKYSKDPHEKQNAHLPQLAKFYVQTKRMYIVDATYQKYVDNESLRNKKTVAHTKSFDDWYKDVEETPHSKDVKEVAGKLGGRKNKNASKNLKAGIVEPDENTVYEDENVIVFLANDTSNPLKSIQNCKKYGAGTELCIASSTADAHYHDYRLGKQGKIGSVTTYFTWLKGRKMYLLVDRSEDGRYSINDIRENDDIPSLPEEIIYHYPELEKPIKEEVFKFIPIEGIEKEMYKVMDASSILSLDTFKERVIYASVKPVFQSEWEKLYPKELPHILRVNIENTDIAIPKEVFDKYPSLKRRYIERTFDLLTPKVFSGFRKVNMKRRISLDEFFEFVYQSMVDEDVRGYNNYTYFTEQVQPTNRESDILWGDWENTNKYRENLMYSIISEFPFLKIRDEILEKYPKIREIKEHADDDVKREIVESIRDDMSVKSFVGILSKNKILYLKTHLDFLGKLLNEKFKEVVMDESVITALSIMEDSGYVLRIPGLKHIDKIEGLTYRFVEMDFPDLETAGDLEFNGAHYLSMQFPKLNKCLSLSFKSSFSRMNFNSLETVAESISIHRGKAENITNDFIEFPKLKNCLLIYMITGKPMTLSLPSFRGEESGEAAWIYLYEDNCTIIAPKDSVFVKTPDNTPNFKVNIKHPSEEKPVVESFKKFLRGKYLK